MAKVKTPVEGYSGTVAGVEFKDGSAETDNAGALAYFARHGYEIDHGKSESKSTAKKSSSAKK